MFIVVLVTLVISIIGLFAQVLQAQTAQMYRNQSALMQTMATWHGGAVALAKANPTLIPVLTATGSGACQMTSTATLDTLANCGFAPATVTAGAANYLPPGYKTTPYTFYSTAYQTGGVDYVATFAWAGTDGNIYLPDTATGSEIGYTTRQLLTQFSRSGSQYLAYGAVTTAGGGTAPGTLTVYAKSNGATAQTLAYTIPTNIPLGAVGIISLAQ